MSYLEQRFDELSQALVTGVPRRTVLRMGLAFVGAAVASMTPLGVFAKQPADGGNSGCAHFCKELPPGQRGQCVSDAAHGNPSGFCAQCGGDPANICGNPANQVCCDPASCCLDANGNGTCCNTAAGEQCVNGTCVAGCIPGSAEFPVRCGTVNGNHVCTCYFTTEDSTFCAAPQGCAGGACSSTSQCPSGWACVFTPGSCSGGPRCMPPCPNN